MRNIHLYLLLIGLAFISSGCVLVRDATDLIAYRSCESIDEYFEKKRNCRWAAEAWEEFSKNQPTPFYSQDFAIGFKEGYAKYLYDGTHKPPVLPPRRYRKSKYQTPEGYRAKQDWFAGYRQGVAIAKEQGFRDLVTGPSALRENEIRLPQEIHLPQPVEFPVPPFEETLPAPSMDEKINPKEKIKPVFLEVKEGESANFPMPAGKKNPVIPPPIPPGEMKIQKLPYEESKLAIPVDQENAQGIPPPVSPGEMKIQKIGFEETKLAIPVEEENTPVIPPVSSGEMNIQKVGYEETKLAIPADLQENTSVLAPPNPSEKLNIQKVEETKLAFPAKETLVGVTGNFQEEPILNPPDAIPDVPLPEGRAERVKMGTPRIGWHLNPEPERPPVFLGYPKPENQKLDLPSE